MDDPGDKISIPDFAKRIKAKYPEYAGVEDTLLTNKIIEKHPEYADMVDLGVKKKVSGEPATNGASPSPSQSSAAPKYEFGKGSLVGTPATPVQMPGEKTDDTVHEDDPVGSAIQPHLNEHTKLVNEYNNSGLSQRQVSESTSQKRPTQTIVGSGKTYKENLQTKLQRTANDVNNTHEAVVNAVLPNVDAAKEFLDKTVAKNKGELPQNNVTANLAIQKINDFKEREQAIKSAPDFTTAAIEDAARNNPTVAEQIKTIQEQNPGKPLKEILPGAMVGRMVDNFYKDKDNQDVINHNPELKEAFDNLGKNNLTDNPEYGANVVGNELSRARQSEGKNNPVANAIIGSSKYMNDLAARLYKNDPQKLAIYNDIVKKDFNKYIDTKDFVSSFAEGGKDVFKGIGHTFKELTGQGSDAESAYNNLQQQNEQVSSGAKGIYEYTDPAGRMAGMIAAMTATGGALRGVGVGEKLANAVNVGTTFWGDEKNKFRLKYPGDPLKQNIGATLMTTAYLAAPNAVPSNKIGKLMGGIKPEMESLTEQLANGSITKEAAKSKALYAFEQALKFGKTAGKQELKGAGEMTAITAFGQGLDKALGLSGAKEKEFHPEGELEDVAKTMLIGNAIPSLLFGAAGIKSRPYTKESLYEMASNPKRFQNVLYDQMLTDPEGHSKIEAKLNDLDHLVRTKAELDAHTDLTPEQKKQYILHDYNEQILKQKAETVTNEFLKGKIEDQIKKSKEIKENIFKGKSTDILPQEDHLTAKEYKEVSEIKNDKELFDYFVSKATKGYASTLKAAAEMEGDTGVKEGIKYMQDKAVENPKKFREDFGDALTEKMLDKATTQEIGDSYYNLIDINSDDPSIPILEKLLDEREAKGEVYKPEETESTSDAEANQPIEPAKESYKNSENTVNLQGNGQEASNIGPEKNKGDSNNSQSISEESPEKQRKLSERYKKIADEADLSHPYDTALKYFADGGRINPSELERVFGGKGDKAARLGLTKNNAGTVKQIAHDLWENDKTGRYQDTDYIDAIERALSDFNSKAAMQKDLVERHDIDAAYEKYMTQRHGKEAINIVESLTEDEINHLLKLDADTNKETELQNYIDNLVKSKGGGNAIQESSPSGILQHPQEGVGETGGERGGVESVQQGQEPPGTRLTIEEGQGAGKEKVTSIKNEKTKEERKERGLGEVEVEAKRTFGDVFDKGKEMVENGDIDPRLLAKEMSEKPRPLKPEESVALLYDRMRLHNEYQKTNKEIIEAAKNGDDVKEGLLRAKLKEIEELRNINDIASRKTGYEQGLGLGIRQLMIKEDYSLLNQLQEYKAANGGKDLSPEQRAHLEDLTNKLDEANKKLEEYAKKIAELEAQKNVNKNAGKKNSKKSNDDFKKERENIFDNIKKKWDDASKGSTLTAVPVPYAAQLAAIAPEVLKLIKSYGEQGIVKLSEIVDDIHGNLKTGIPNIKKEDVVDILAGKYTEKKQKPQLDRNEMMIKANVEKIKKQIDAEKERIRLDNRGNAERYVDYFHKWRRFALLSGVKVLGKIGTAAAARSFVTSPLESAVGGVLNKVPGISKLAKGAPREGAGFNRKAEAKALTQWVDKMTYKDIGEIMKTGKGELDYLYSDKNYPPGGWLDFFGQLHAAIKNLPKRAEFFRAYELRAEHAAKNNMDLKDPLVQQEIALGAYNDSMRSIFMQDNYVTDAYKSMLRALENSKISGGEAAANVMKFMFPIIKVPTNYVAEQTSYMIGGLKGAWALRKGIKEMTPDQRDYVMRAFKKQTIGIALMLMGYFNPKAVGGYYSGKRKEDDLQSGDLVLFGVPIPHWMSHTPMLEALQLGATLRRSKDAAQTKGKSANVLTGLPTVFKGVSEQIPFFGQSSQISSAVTSIDGAKKYLFRMGQGVIEPQLIKEAAEKFDTNGEGESNKRYPKDFMEYLKSGIPGLREELPLKPEKKKN